MSLGKHSYKFWVSNNHRLNIDKFAASVHLTSLINLFILLTLWSCHSVVVIHDVFTKCLGQGLTCQWILVEHSDRKGGGSENVVRKPPQHISPNDVWWQNLFCSSKKKRKKFDLNRPWGIWPQRCCPCRRQVPAESIIPRVGSCF